MAERVVLPTVPLERLSHTVQSVAVRGLHVFPFPRNHEAFGVAPIFQPHNQGLNHGPRWIAFPIRLNNRPVEKPKTATSTDNAGLDPHARRVARESAAAEAREVPPLNPPFPYTKTPFDPWFYNLEDDPPKAGATGRRV